MFQLNPHAGLSTSAALLLMNGGIPALSSEVDSRIEASARRSFNFKTYLRKDGIQLDCSHGVVTLKGSVDQELHRDLAERTAADLPGVRRVVNEVTVRGNTPVPLSDAWITLKVRASLAFLGNAGFPAPGIQTKEGVVTVSGRVESQALKRKAMAYIMDVEGVLGMRGDLLVSSLGRPQDDARGPWIDDSSITAQIWTMLLLHHSVTALPSKVITRDGCVALHGAAASPAEKRLLAELAGDIQGVRRVTNLMTVGRPKAMPDLSSLSSTGVAK